MKAGKYYVGDLCYVISDFWDEYCDLVFPSNKRVEGELTLPNGIKIASFGTAFGDGCYTDNFGNEYCVDSGGIGCILVSDIPGEFHGTKLGAVIEFAEDFEVSSDGENLFFGHVVIETGADPYDEDVDEEQE